MQGERKFDKNWPHGHMDSDGNVVRILGEITAHHGVRFLVIAVKRVDSQLRECEDVRTVYTNGKSGDHSYEVFNTPNRWKFRYAFRVACNGGLIVTGDEPNPGDPYVDVWVSNGEHVDEIRSGWVPLT